MDEIRIIRFEFLATKLERAAEVGIIIAIILLLLVIGRSMVPDETCDHEEQTIKQEAERIRADIKRFEAANSNKQEESDEQ